MKLEKKRTRDHDGIRTLTLRFVDTSAVTENFVETHLQAACGLFDHVLYKSDALARTAAAVYSIGRTHS